MTNIGIDCPHCGKCYTVTDAALGKYTTCKACERKFVIRDGKAARPRGTDGIPLNWEPGDVILDLYEVIALPGTKHGYAEGGMGRVNLVRHRGWQRDIAVKSVLPARSASARDVENFKTEAEQWVETIGLHPNVVACHYVRELGGVPRVFIEYVDGGTLQEWVISKRLYEGGHAGALARILDIAIQTAWGLDYVHELGLIHQDVKPLNVMMTKAGVAKVTDFGLAGAKAISAGEPTATAGGLSLLATGAGMMTPAYCSPEQAEIQARKKGGASPDKWPKLTRRTDVWSWAVSVLYLFLGKIAWPGGQVAHVALGREPDEPHLPPMPEAVKEVLRGCFQKRQEDRARDLLQVADALVGIYQGVAGRPYHRERPNPEEALADALNNRAVSLVDLKKQEAAEKKWQEALRIDPHHPETTYNRGLIQWRTLRLTDRKLLEQLREVRTSSVDAARVDYLTGLVHLERTDAPAAIEALSKAVEADTDRPEVTAALAVAKSLSAPTDQLPRTFEELPIAVTSAAFSPDGRFVLSGGHDKTMRLWEVSSGKCLRTFEGHTRNLNSVAFGPDGRYAFSGSKDMTVRLWEVESGQCLRTFEGHRFNVGSVAWSPDGRFALSGGNDNTVRLWDVGSGQCLRTFEEHTSSVTSVAWSPDGRFALSGSEDRTLRLRGITFAKQHVPLVICTRSAAGSTKYQNLLRQVRDALARNPADAVGFLQQARQHPGCSHREDSLELARQLSRALRHRSFVEGWGKRIFAGHTSGVSSVALSPDGRLALSGSWDKTLRLWEVASGQCLRTFAGHASGVSSVAWSLDGRRALSACEKQTLRQWDVSNGECLQTFKGTTGAENSAAWSPDGRFALLGSIGGGPSLWEVKGRKLLRHLTGPVSPVTSVSWSPDGRLAVLGSEDKTLRVWEVESGKCLRTFEGHTSPVTSASWSPDGRLFLSGSTDKALRLWEAESGKCLGTFEGHTNSVKSVAFSPDGRFALSGSNDHTLRLWEVASGKCLRSFAGHTHWVNSVAFSPDGRFALSGSLDQTLRLWELDWEFEPNQPADWDEAARHFLTTFLTSHTHRDDRLIHQGKPSWAEEDFRRLLDRLSCAGFGWLRPDGVRRELDRMDAAWQGPPPLFS